MVTEPPWSVKIRLTKFKCWILLVSTVTWPVDLRASGEVLHLKQKSLLLMTIAICSYELVQIPRSGELEHLDLQQTSFR